jgi:cullin 3
VQNRNESQLSYEELYRNAYNLVMHKHGNELYNMVHACIQDYVNNIRRRVESAPTVTFLQVLSKCWEDHFVSMVMTRDILLYLVTPSCRCILLVMFYWSYV